MAEQAGKLIHTSNLFHHEWAGKLAEALVTLTQRDGGLGWHPSGKVFIANGDGRSNPDPGSSALASSPPGAKVFFANSGTEANEGALKIARLVGKQRWAASKGKSWDDPSCDKLEIVCFENGFHGRSMGALSVTNNPKYQKPFTPLIPGVKMGRLNVAEDVERLIGEGTCAVIVEPIQGEGGVNAANTMWLKGLRKRCDDVGAVLIYDEIQVSGFSQIHWKLKR
jgi:acetylornithine aminotransferase